MIHHRDAVGHGHRLELVVRDVDHRLLELALQLFELGAHDCPEGRVDIGQRLVEQEDRRLHDRRAADRHALQDVDRKPLRLAVEQRRQLQHLGDSAETAVDLGLGGAAHPRPVGEVLPHRHVGEDRIILEDEADAAPPHRHAGHVALAEKDAAAGRLLHAGDHIHRRRLAAAGRPEQRHELAVGDFEVHRLQRGEVAECLGEVLEVDRAHWCTCRVLAMRFMA